MHIGFVHLGRENLGIEYLSAVAKQKGHDVTLYYDPGLFGQNDNVFFVPRLERLFDKKAWLIQRVLADRPDVLCFSAYTTTVNWALDFARQIRQSTDIPILFGGLHVTVSPRHVMDEPAVGMAVMGEGEAVFEQALLAVTGKGDPSDVPGLVWRKNDKTILNSLGDPIDPLDDLPLPDKALFEKDVNFADDYMVMTNRGCPFSCSYCCESVINRMYDNKFFRRRSVDSVIEELEAMLGRYRYREVMFNDSIFFTHKQWLFELLDRYRATIRRPFRCFGQVKYLDDEIADLLVRSGCYAIEFGVQTMNETVRKNILNRTESNEENARAFALCDRRRIHYDIDHIFGLPTETEQDFFDAARFYSGLKYLNRIKCHYLTYFPGTTIVDTALELGLIGEEKVRRIHAGDVGDFFHDAGLPDRQKALAEKFHRFFKVLPLLPKSWTEWLVKKGRHGWFASIPSVGTILLQVVAAIKGRDYRFFLYVKYYLLRLRRNRFLIRYNRKNRRGPSGRTS